MQRFWRAASAMQLQRMMDIFVEVTEAYGQEVSIKKTEVMVVQPRVSQVMPPLVITIHGKVLQQVKHFKYVGSTENDSANMTDEIDIRIRSMLVAYTKLAARVFENRNLNLVTRWAAFQAFVISNATYGCSSWNTSQKQLKKLESLHFRLIRSMFRCTWKDKKSYLYFIEKLSTAGVIFVPIEGSIRLARLKYLGHVQRMSDERHAKVVLHADVVGGSRMPGAQEANFRRCVREDMVLFGIDPSTWQTECMDREVWRNMCRQGLAKFRTGWLDVRVRATVKRHSQRAARESVANASAPKLEMLGNSVVVVDYTRITEAISTTGRTSSSRGPGGIGATVGTRRGTDERVRRVRPLLCSRVARLAAKVRATQYRRGAGGGSYVEAARYCGWCSGCILYMSECGRWVGHGAVWWGESYWWYYWLS